jgi:hypothetical protein|tara:strand:- start:603 stop:806 length:204 start_codon:yes stop_codon:yes gene_type:complete
MECIRYHYRLLLTPAQEEKQIEKIRELQKMSSLAAKIRNGRANWVDDSIKEMYRNGYQHSKSKYFNE